MKPIWIVDDDQSIRFVLEKALLRENLPTRSFTNPQEVLNALDEGPDSEGPQILVSDIRMPGGRVWTCWTRSRNGCQDCR
jgi:two-component system, NtrC family, nitrogen regulation response regulator GlnG